MLQNGEDASCPVTNEPMKSRAIGSTKGTQTNSPVEEIKRIVNVQTPVHQ